MLTSCHIWTEVDFGEGPVKIRCTEVGEHDDHRCEVAIIVDEVTDMADDISISHRNVFDRRAG